MRLKDDVYNHEWIITRLLEKIKNSDLDEQSKKLLSDFYTECVVQSLSKARIAKLLDTLWRVSKWFGKPLEDVGREDITRLVVKVESADYSPWTKHDYKAIIKQFFKWLRKTEEYPPEVK